MSYKTEDKVFYIVAGVIIVLGVAFTIYAITYRKTIRIIVKDRYWVSTTSVEYKETDTEIKCAPDIDGEVTCKTETTTSTHTRCSDSLSSRYLPVEYPDPPCAQRVGDYIDKDVVYKIKYVEVGTDEEVSRKFSSASQWDRLVPHRQNTVEVDLFGNVVGFAE